MEEDMYPRRPFANELLGDKISPPRGPQQKRISPLCSLLDTLQGDIHNSSLGKLTDVSCWARANSISH